MLCLKSMSRVAVMHCQVGFAAGRPMQHISSTMLGEREGNRKAGYAVTSSLACFVGGTWSPCLKWGGA